MHFLILDFLKTATYLLLQAVVVWQVLTHQADGFSVWAVRIIILFNGLYFVGIVRNVLTHARQAREVNAMFEREEAKMERTAMRPADDTPSSIDELELLMADDEERYKGFVITSSIEGKYVAISEGLPSIIVSPSFNDYTDVKKWVDQFLDLDEADDLPF